MATPTGNWSGLRQSWLAAVGTFLVGYLLLVTFVLGLLVWVVARGTDAL